MDQVTFKEIEIDTSYCDKYKQDWNLFISEYLGVRLDRDQRKIVRKVQKNRRVTVRSGHARGKDYVAAAIALAFLYLHYPSKVIMTAPTGRQVISIMMAEVSKMFKNSI